MILKYLRKKTRAILIGTLILIIPAFIFLYGWSRLSNREKIPYIIAKIDRTPITWEEYQNELQRYINLLGHSYSAKLEKQIKSQVLDGLIEKYLLIGEAKKINIKVTDDEIALKIREIFKNEKGNFDKKTFLLISKQNPEKINELEQNLRTQATIEKLKDGITNSVKVSEDEAYKYFLTSDAKAKIKYIAIKPDDFKGNIEASENELKDYYEQNKESFKNGPWRKIEYITINEDQINNNDIKLEPNEVEEYYSEHLEEWTGENGDTEPLLLAEVKDKIEQELKDNKKEELLKDKAWEISDELFNENDWNSFAKHKGLSYDITGYFTKEEPIPEFDSEKITVINQTAFSLTFKEVSEPLRIEKGYLIIRPLDEEPKYEELVDKIRKIIVEEKSKNLTEKTAEEIVSELQKGEKIEDISKKYSKEVKESEYFSRFGFIKDIGYTPEVIQAAFSLDKDKWDKVNTASGEIFIIQTVDIQEPSPEEFKDKKESITTLLLSQKKQQVFMEWLKELKEKNKDRISILWDELLPSHSENRSEDSANRAP